MKKKNKKQPMLITYWFYFRNSLLAALDIIKFKQ